MKHEKSLNILKTAKGQIDAIIRMIEEDRYCVDISKQILAAISLLKKANVQILNNHLESCVKEAFFAKDPQEVDIKIKELENLIEYLNKII